MAETEDSLSEKQEGQRPNLTVLNTGMAADRTLMAWIRTALSMMTFGFTLFKVLDAIRQTGRVLPNENTPRNAGLVLVAMGTVAVLMGLIEFWQTRRQLTQFQGHKLPYSPTWVMAILTSAGGIFLIFIILTRAL
jgi:putative membrane protein